MKSENITIETVLDIFSDYLEQNENFEIVKTKKMGLFSILDASAEKDRSHLSIEPVLDTDDLIRQTLWVEISDCYYDVDHGKHDPYECDETVETLVYARMKPRLDQLPEKWADALEEFFSNPDQCN